MVMGNERTGMIGRFRMIPAIAVSIAVLGMCGIPHSVDAATAKEIDVSADVALENFMKEVNGAREFLASAKGLLIFPNVYKAGFWIGGEYGEGVMRIGGRSIEYYSLASASFGVQFGAQKKTIILVFMQDEALQKFRQSEGWEVGVDGSVAIVDVGAGGSIDSTTINQPILAFVISQKGLMINISLEGTKFTKIKK